MYIYYLCINTNKCMYMFKKNMLCLYIKYIYKVYNINIYTHVNIFNIYAVCVCVCVYIYIINKHSTHTYFM